VDDDVVNGLVVHDDDDEDAANLSTLLEITTTAASIEGVLGNTLHYTPHNFHQPIMIHYPTAAATTAPTVGCYNSTISSYNSHNNTTTNNNNNLISLPVCAKCKKHCKTRDNCRIKYGHTEVPWTNSYICITIDESCIGMDGKYIVEENDAAKLHAVVLSSPQTQSSLCKKYEVQTCLDDNAPVCSTCKSSNRTRAYCRKKFRHGELPWNTLYVVLKLQSNMMMMMTCPNFLDPFHQECRDGRSSTVDDDNNMMPNPVDHHDDVVSTLAKEVGKDTETKEQEQHQQQQQEEQTQEQSEQPKELPEEFDINRIAPSRTFLSIISSEENSIRWLKRVETTDDDDDDDNTNNNDDERPQKQPPPPPLPQQQDLDFMSSNPYYYPRLNVGGPIQQYDSLQSSLQESVKAKKKRKKKTKKVETTTKKTTTSSSSKKKKSKKSTTTTSTKNRDETQELDNAKLALEAIEHAKQLARREEDAARLMRQRFVRFTQQQQPPPQLMMQQPLQQQQQHLLIQQQMLPQQQTMYQLQLQDTTQKQCRSDDNDQSYVDEKMTAADDDLEKINDNDDDDEDKMPSMLNDNGEEDILDEAAKLAEWL
jgi:hypothetical protein